MKEIKNLKEQYRYEQKRIKQGMLMAIIAPVLSVIVGIAGINRGYLGLIIVGFVFFISVETLGVIYYKIYEKRIKKIEEEEALQKKKKETQSTLEQPEETHATIE